MATVRIAWDTTVIESYSCRVDYDDFTEALRARGQEPPTLDDLKASGSGANVPGWDQAGSDFEDEAEGASTTDREITSISVFEDPAGSARNSDRGALDAIQEMLRDPEWGVGMLEDIAQILEKSGRKVSNYPDNRPAWGRH